MYRNQKYQITQNIKAQCIKSSKVLKHKELNYLKYQSTKYQLTKALKHKVSNYQRYQSKKYQIIKSIEEQSKKITKTITLSVDKFLK